jgi:hypothetical protein
MTIDLATGISRILKQEGVGWVSTFPVCRVNNALGREGVPMLMMRDAATSSRSPTRSRASPGAHAVAPLAHRGAGSPAS